VSVSFELRTPPGAKDDGSALDAVEYISIAIPAVNVGSKDVVHRQATDADRAQYAEEYAAFKGAPAKAIVPEAPEAKAEEPEAEPKKSKSFFKK
jgi:hypothetical protein